jgi:hypothetical protein
VGPGLRRPARGNGGRGQAFREAPPAARARSAAVMPRAALPALLLPLLSLAAATVAGKRSRGPRSPSPRTRLGGRWVLKRALGSGGSPRTPARPLFLVASTSWAQEGPRSRLADRRAEAYLWALWGDQTTGTSPAEVPPPVRRGEGLGWRWGRRSQAFLSWRAALFQLVEVQVVETGKRFSQITPGPKRNLSQ